MIAGRQSTVRIDETPCRRTTPAITRLAPHDALTLGPVDEGWCILAGQGQCESVTRGLIQSG